MESTTYELALDCHVLFEKNRKKIKKTSYMITTLFSDHYSSASEKHITDRDAKGSAKLKFKDVNVESGFLRFQVFIQSMLFGEKQVGNIYVRVSDLMSSSITSDLQMNQVGLATYDFGKTSKKHKGDLKLWFKLSKTQEQKAEVESQYVAAAIGNDMVPSLGTPLLSINWRS